MAPDRVKTGAHIHMEMQRVPQFPQLAIPILSHPKMTDKKRNRSGSAASGSPERSVSKRENLPLLDHTSASSYIGC